MQLLPRRINVISGSWTPGTTSQPLSADTKFRALDIRPAGKYAYVKGLRVRAVCTIAESGSGQALTAAKQLQMLRSLSFSHDEHDRMTALSFLRLAQRMQMIDEIMGPDAIADKLPIASVASGSGTTAKTLEFVIPLAPGMYGRNRSPRTKFSGLVSTAQLQKSGKLEILGCSALNITGTQTNYWSCTAITIDAWLEMFYSDYPIEPVLMRESVVESSINSIQSDWDGERRLFGAIVVDDSDSDITANNGDGVISIDSQVIDTSVSSAELVAETNTQRLDGINDYWPTCIPVITLAGRALEECPIVRDSLKLEKLNSGHSGLYHLFTVQAKRCDLNLAAQILRLQKVPQEAIDAYVSAVRARSVTEAREEIGLAVRVLQSEAAMGVQNYV